METSIDFFQLDPDHRFKCLLMHTSYWKRFFPKQERNWTNKHEKKHISNGRLRKALNILKK